MKVLLEHEGEKLWLSIPMSCDEITFEQFIDFTSYEQKYFKNTEEDNDIDNVVTYLIEALTQVCEGPVQNLPFSHGENIEQLMKSGFRLDISTIGHELTVMKLYVHVVNMISSYVPTEIPVDYVLSVDGTEYMVNQGEAVRSLLNVPLTAGEVITTLELQRKTLKQINKKGDLDGNMAFNLGLQEVAILLRKKGELLPANRRQRIAFINDRVQLFKDLSMTDVLRLRFFLVHIMKEYLKTHLTSFSLNHQED